MATQSLYRRYRPRRFSEVKGQDHVVRALRDAVAEGRSGQAYLFSGPRGTGKTTTARILAKVLNCENVVDGEPCCECESCLAVERGTSYDVHELDAASNNGVEAIRDLIEKAALGTPGRHKVYILDEVHMLSRPAEAALLKTLEEPPPHVVFVLATTDPQKMSDTIRSRTQHLQFHLLPTDTLAEHVAWVARDAGYDLPQAALDAALVQGGGSARDTLSALELLASTGGEMGEVVDLDEFLHSIVEHDPGRALAAMAHAVNVGRDPRTVTEDLVRHLRNAFLALMAPELVVLPRERIDGVAALAQQIGAAGLVRAIEQLGTTLVDLRSAPDPRVLVEVVLVQLTSEAAGGDTAALVARLERLEDKLRQLTKQLDEGAARPTTPTGRAVLGGAAKRTAPEPSREGAPGAPAAATPVPATERVTASAPSAVAASSGFDTVAAAWEGAVRGALKPLVRALFSAGSFVGESAADGGTVARFEVPNEAHGAKCAEHKQAVELALSEAIGRKVTIEVVTGRGEPARGERGPDRAPPATPRPQPTTSHQPATERARVAAAALASDPEPGELAGEGRPPVFEPEDEIDLGDLTDVPPEAVKGPLDQLHEAFPGSLLISPDE
jgi:DNA polymerase-3 subunit gamma/tau